MLRSEIAAVVLTVIAEEHVGFGIVRPILVFAGRDVIVETVVVAVNVAVHAADDGGADGKAEDAGGDAVEVRPVPAVPVAVLVGAPAIVVAAPVIATAPVRMVETAFGNVALLRPDA